MLNPAGSVGFAQVAAFHGHAVQAVLEPGQLRAVLLHGRNDLDAHGVEPLDVGGEAVALLGRAGAQGLELLAGGGLAGAQRLLNLSLGRGAALGLPAWGNLFQAVFQLDLPHQPLLALVVVPVADDLAVSADPGWPGCGCARARCRCGG